MMLRKIAFLLLVATLVSCNGEPKKEKFKPEVERQKLNNFLDQWHDDAAHARPAYFDKMAEGGIYIGTDKTELWEREEFREWSQKYFEQGKGWDFDAKERNIYFSEKGDYAWFDELLETWMGDCRGSGVVHETPSGWEIEHYHLSVTVPNDTIDGFIEMVRAFEAKRPPDK